MNYESRHLCTRKKSFKASSHVSGRRALSFASVSAAGIYSQRKDLILESSLNMVDYKLDGQISSQYPGWGDAMSTILELPRAELLYRSHGRPRDGNRAMGMLEQKKISWVMDLVRKISRPGDVVSDSLLFRDLNRNYVSYSTSTDYV